MIRALLRGGPKDGTMFFLPNAMPTFEVMRAEPIDWAKALKPGEAAATPTRITTGRYELVPEDKDPLHRLARLYVWAGWYP